MELGAAGYGFSTNITLLPLRGPFGAELEIANLFSNSALAHLFLLRTPLVGKQLITIDYI